MSKQKFICRMCNGEDAPPCVLEVDSTEDNSPPRGCPFGCKFDKADWELADLSLDISRDNAQILLAVVVATMEANMGHHHTETNPRSRDEDAQLDAMLKLDAQLIRLLGKDE